MQGLRDIFNSFIPLDRQKTVEKKNKNNDKSNSVDISIQEKMISKEKTSYSEPNIVRTFPKNTTVRKAKSIGPIEKIFSYLKLKPEASPKESPKRKKGIFKDFKKDESFVIATEKRKFFDDPPLPTICLTINDTGETVIVKTSPSISKSIYCSDEDLIRVRKESIDNKNKSNDLPFRDDIFGKLRISTSDLITDIPRPPCNTPSSPCKLPRDTVN